MGTKQAKSVGVIGAGAWGTAVAHALGRTGNDVSIWALEQDVVDSINNKHENNRYLPGFALSENVKASTDIKEVATNKEFLILASPSLFLASTVKKILDVPSIADGSTCIGVLTKGFISTPDGPKLILEELESVMPKCYEKNLVYIAGPSHAEEVALGKLTGLVAACENPKNTISFRNLLNGKCLMVYSSFDVVGVQVCAAAKNVIAIAFGILDAIAESQNIFGDNTESFLFAAGLNEIQTIGKTMGATHSETFTSISGVGDLDVTCRSKYGRNRRLGQEIITKNLLKDFSSIDDLISRIGEIGYLPEGAVACKHVNEIATKFNIKVPICSGLFKILNREIEPLEILKELVGEDE